MRKASGRVRYDVNVDQQKRINPNYKVASIRAGLICGLGMCVGLALNGCSSDDGALAPRPMPTMGAFAALASPPVAPDAVLAEARRAIGKDDPASAVRALETLAVAERAGTVRKLMSGLAPENFMAAERVAATLSSGLLQAEATDILANARFAHDSVEATQWALTVAAQVIAPRARHAVAENLVAREPGSAMERLLALPDSAPRREMLGYAAARWARRDATAALAWVRSLNPGESRDRMMTSICFALAQSDPARAAELLAALPEGRDRAAVTGAVGQIWIALDERAAWKWAHQLPAGAAREAAFAGIETGLGGAGSRLVQNDTRFTGRTGSAGLGSTRGGGSLPLGAQRDDALRREFDEALQESPARAASLLTALPAPDRRDEMVSELVRRWLPINPEATKTWVDQNVPNPARREMLLREAGQFRN